MESFERQGGGRDPRLDRAKPPKGFEYIWTLYFELRQGASEGMAGARITWRDLEAYQAVTGAMLDAFEVEAVLAMDRALAEALSDRTP